MYKETKREQIQKSLARSSLKPDFSHLRKSVRDSDNNAHLSLRPSARCPSQALPPFAGGLDLISNRHSSRVDGLLGEIRGLRITDSKTPDQITTRESEA